MTTTTTTSSTDSTWNPIELDDDESLRFSGNSVTSNSGEDALMEEEVVIEEHDSVR
jgi:hypothetical protein